MINIDFKNKKQKKQHNQVLNFVQGSRQNVAKQGRSKGA